jgi:esterase/lipase superfamily enzyme
MGCWGAFTSNTWQPLRNHKLLTQAFRAELLLSINSAKTNRQMTNPTHVQWLDEGVKRWNTRRRKITFKPDLQGINFFIHLPDDFRDSPKTSRYFERINLSNSNLIRANLSSLNFQGANFKGADLSGADLSKSNFRRANFTSANLSGVDLQSSILAGAIFKNTKFDGENIQKIKDRGDINIDEYKIDKDNRYTFTIQSRFEDRDLLRIQPRYGSGPISDSKRKPGSSKDRYDVFYATTRTPIVERGAIVSYSSGHSEATNYGICEVIMPENRPIGKIGTSLWKRLVNYKENTIHIENLINLDSEHFWSSVRDIYNSMNEKSKFTIFVHGFNNTFEDSVVRAAQLGRDIGLGQGIGLFSWPSQGSILGYSADEAASETSKYPLADFMENFIINHPEKSINIIAHSMGCRCVLGAIEILSSKSRKIAQKIDKIILAAADVDSTIMPRMGIHAIKNAKRTTSYVADTDKALKISGWLHKFPRVGTTPPTYIIKGMDTILVNDEDRGKFSHEYIGSNLRVLDDIYHILGNDLPPSKRYALEQLTEMGEIYWRMKN